MLGIDCSGCHRWRQDSKSLIALLVLFEALRRRDCEDHVLSLPVHFSQHDPALGQFLAQLLFALIGMEKMPLRAGVARLLEAVGSWKPGEPSVDGFADAFSSGLGIGIDQEL